MKKLLLFILPLIVGIGIFVWIIKITGWREILQTFFVFTGWNGIALLLITFLAMLVGVWKWQIILKSQGEKVSFKSLVAPYFGNFSLTYLAPTIFFAGETFRSYLAKKKNSSLPWEKIISSVFLDRLLDSSVMLVAVVLGVLYFLFKIGIPSQNLSVFLGIVFVLFLFVIVFFYFKFYKKQSILKFVSGILRINFLKEDHIAYGIEKEVFAFFHQRKYFTKVIFVSILRNVLLWLRHWLLILFLGAKIGLFGALSVLSFSYLASLIPIPAALGSHEAIQAFVFSNFRMEESMGTVFAIVLRGADVAIALIGIAILARIGYKFAQKKLNNNH